MTEVVLADVPALFQAKRQRETLRFQAESYVARANQMMRRARALVEADRVDAIALLTIRRTTLRRHFQSYQQLKHNSIFDPIVTYAPTSSRIIARTMKVDCMELSEEFGAYHSRWVRASASEWRYYKNDMLETVEKLAVNLAAELRSIHQLIMVADLYQIEVLPPNAD